MRAECADNEIAVFDAYLHRETLKEIAGRRWDAKQKAWFVPNMEASIKLLAMLGAELDDGLKAAMRADTETGNMDGGETPLSIKPYAHQIRGFNLCMRNDGYGLLFSVGLGKSATAIGAAGARFNRGELKRLLIVCPLAVQSVWEREAKNLTVENSVRVLEGNMAKRRDALRHFPKDGLQIAVINYEGARIMTDDLLNWKPEMLIVDESQRIKRSQTAQAKAMHKIAKQTKYRIILTATPIGNSVEDVFSQWKVIDPEIFGNSLFSFKRRYIIEGGYGGYQIIGYKNMPEFLQKAHSKALRVTAEEALDLPEQIFENRYCKLEPKARLIYDRLKHECVSELERGEVTATNILTQLLRLQQAADGFLKADGTEDYVQVSTAKLDLLKDTLGDILDAGEKVVLFCRFTVEIEAISRMLSRDNVPHELLTGAVKNKGEVIEKFQSDKAVKVLICQTQVGGVGITLTAASVMIFYSNSFSFIDYTQAVGRIHRIGQKRRCLYINLLAENTVDDHIIAAIQSKKSLSDACMDNWRTIVGGGAMDTS
jgi:SNF2 family DNA or RNA helicase